MKSEASLSPSEVEILQRSIEDPNIFTDYFFRPEGAEKGWIFDYNFTEEGAWQKKLHHAKQKDITIIGGFGTGKTLGVAMSACVWCALTTDFKFLNAAPNAWQSKQMYDLVLLTSRGTRFEQLIWSKPQKPYPKIVLRYRIGSIVYESSLEFMSVDKNAQGILTWEGDWLHIDEAGLLDNLEEVIINVGSRLRGTVRGRERLGRFSMTSNSWDNFQLWYYFDLAASEPEDYLSLQLRTADNKNVTPAQFKRMLARIPKEERQRFLDGSRPEGRGRYFNKESVYACEIPGVGQWMEEQIEKERSFYLYEKNYGTGVTRFQTPPEKFKLYMTFGDPGDDKAPKRNAPVVMTFDVTEFPVEPARLVSFWWGDGGGRINPFIAELFRQIKLYRSIFAGIDSTGPQKNMNTLINEYAFQEEFKDNGEHELTAEASYTSPMGIVRGIHGMDFSGAKKSSYLIALRLLIEAQRITWPKAIAGIRSQLTNYDPEKDQGVRSKIAQDIVATMAMGAFAMRIWFHVDPQTLVSETTQMVDTPAEESRRLPSEARSKRSAAGRGT